MSPVISVRMNAPCAYSDTSRSVVAVGDGTRGACAGAVVAAVNPSARISKGRWCFMAQMFSRLYCTVNDAMRPLVSTSPRHFGGRDSCPVSFCRYSVLLCWIVVVVGPILESAAQPSRPVPPGYVTSSQWLTPKGFLQRLKTVAVDLTVEPSVLVHLPQATVHAMLVRHLAERRIRTQPGSSVRLHAQVLHRRGMFTSSSVSSSTGVTRSAVQEPIHQLVVWLRFEVTTAVLRRNTFHVLPVVPADGYAMKVWVQEREPLEGMLTQRIAESLADALTTIATNEEPAEPAEWRRRSGPPQCHQR